MISRQVRVAGVAAVCAGLLAVSACSKGSTASSSGGGSTPNNNKVTLAGSITFNDANLDKLRDSIKSALAGKDLSSVDIAMLVNVAADYWTAGQVGFKKGCTELGIAASKCTFFAPPNGKLTEQLSELETLRSQGITGFTVSAIDPSAIKTPIQDAVNSKVNVIAIDSPLPGTAAASLYLGTPNYDAGYQAGTAMKQVLGGKGHVVIEVGSLTAANAVQRIQGFTDAIKGTSITIDQKINDNLSASTAQSDAESVLQTDPNVTGLYGVYSYDGPALAQAVQTAGKSSTVKVVCDDADAQTLGFVGSGVISATVVQQPYMQGYIGAYLLTAEHVLGVDATTALVKQYLASDGSTLSSGVGLITQSDLAAYKSKLSALGIS